MFYTKEYCEELGIEFRVELNSDIDKFDRNLSVSYDGFSSNSFLSANQVEDLKHAGLTSRFIINTIVENFMKKYETNKRVMLNKKLKKIKHEK